MAGWGLMIIHFPGRTALHLQQLRPAVLFICCLIVSDVLKGKKRENERGGWWHSVSLQWAKLEAWDNTTGPCLLQTGRRGAMKRMEASRAGGRGDPHTSSKGLLFFSAFAPKKTQLSLKLSLWTWLLPSSMKCARTLSFILKEGKKVLVWCQVGVPSDPLWAAGSSTSSSPQLWVFGEPCADPEAKLTLWQGHRSWLSARWCRA